MSILFIRNDNLRCGICGAWLGDCEHFNWTY